MNAASATHHEPTPFPIDYERLTYGDTIDRTRVEMILSARSKTGPIRYRTADFAIGIMGLTKEVEDEMESRRRPVVLKQNAGSLIVLSPTEASNELARRNRARRRGIRRNVRRLALVPTADMTDPEKSVHEHRLMAEVRIEAAMTHEVRSIAAKQHVRTTPCLPQFRLADA